jgi:hypothetical protein
MGRESRQFKLSRMCKSCNKPIMGTALDLLQHSVVCRRLTEVGLVMAPHIEEPKGGLWMPPDDMTEP